MLKHRGEILKKVFDESNAVISRVAKTMRIDRGTIYRHFSDPNLSFDYLLKYGKALNVDFSKYFPEMLAMTSEPPEGYGDNKSYSDLQIEVSYWKDKYITLLEKYNTLLNEQLMSNERRGTGGTRSA